MTRPDALEVANEFRRALLDRERDAAARMVRTYGQLHKRLLAELEAVAAKIAEAEKDGLTVSPAWLWQQDRYHAMLRTADREMSEFAQQTLRARGRADARYALSLGQDESKELVQATLAGMPRAERAALMARWGTLDTRALEQMVGIMDPASPVWQSLDRFGPAMRQRIQDVVTQSLAMGYNPNRWARDLRRVTGEGLDWALNWSRTLQLQAYRESTRQAYIQNQNVVRGWTWSATKDERTCMSCIVMDGTHHMLSERLDDHWRGRCAMLPDTKTEFPDEVKAADWFEQQDEATQRAMMGNARYDAWKDGRFELDALTRKVPDDTWGTMRVVTPLKDLGVSAE